MRELSWATGTLGLVETSVFGQALLVTGTEGLLMERAVAKQIRIAKSQRPEAQVNSVTAADLTSGQLAEITGGSLLSESSIVVINSLQDLPQDMADDIMGLVTAPAPDSCVVLVQEGGVKGRALLNSLKKTGITEVPCAPLRGAKLTGYLLDEVRSHGARMDAHGAETLIQAVGSDLRTLVAAIQQLVADSERSTIDAAMIRTYFAGQADVTGFNVADAVVEGRTNLALERARWALTLGVSPVLLTTAMAASLRDMGKFQGARGSRDDETDLARQLGFPQWKVDRITKNLPAWSPQGLSAAIQAVAAADGQIKGAGVDPGYAIDNMILTVVRCRTRT